MMKTNIEQITKLLEELSIELQRLNLWQEHKPSIFALSSSAPFCCDTLTFAQWLQFIFIEKIRQMINQEQSLPTKIALTPMAEESFKHLSAQTASLLVVINKIDKTLTAQGSN
jgi:uncharacterized protein YqcC (DUF446 family)